MNLPNFAPSTRKIIVLGVIMLACVGALVGYRDAIGIAIAGLLGLMKGDD